MVFEWCAVQLPRVPSQVSDQRVAHVRLAHLEDLRQLAVARVALAMWRVQRRDA